MKMITIAILTLALMASSPAGEDARQGCWDTIVQALRVDPGLDLRSMDVPLKGGGVVRLRYSRLKAPRGLALVLGGTFGGGDNGYSNAVARCLMSDGYDVVEMEAFMSASFVGRARIGAPGNLRREAQVAAEAIAAFERRVGDSWAGVSVIGVSYGGGVALQMALLEAEGVLPTKLDHVLALSTPVSFREAMRLLDEYEDLPHSYDKIIPIFLGAKPGAAMPGATLEEMRKVIGRGFRLNLSKAVEYVDRVYPGNRREMEEMGFESLGHRGAERMERNVEAGEVGFRSFFAHWLAPYWIRSGDVKSVDELIDMGEMLLVLPKLGPKVEVVVADDDPLNPPGAIEALRAVKAGATVTVLHGGGHAGFVRAGGLGWVVDKSFKP